ncbi:ferredoxin-type protein NapF [Candidatus Electronema sp. PJ]|uniref:ferredoxin-type protein NapF n=1 Tax=Candidatus Electronema sp. PJ TaxID=3401572 RepID=UPI003AA8864B
MLKNQLDICRPSAYKAYVAQKCRQMFKIVARSEPTMNLASFVANQCLAYLLQNSSDPLQQQRSGGKPPLYPPWSSAADSFRSLCTGCGACAQACGSSIISMNEDDLPTVDFSRGSCTFCGNCAQSCPTGALQFDPDKAPWHLALHIAESCLLRSRMLCLTCVEQCDQEAIRLPQDQGQFPQLATAQCNGCGACASVCPVGAISFVPINEGE